MPKNGSPEFSLTETEAKEIGSRYEQELDNNPQSDEISEIFLGMTKKRGGVESFLRKVINEQNFPAEPTRIRVAEIVVMVERLVMADEESRRYSILFERNDISEQATKVGQEEPSRSHPLTPSLPLLRAG